MLPACSTREGLVLRYSHDFERGSCRHCGATEEVRTDMLTLWRASIASAEPEPAPRLVAHVNGKGSARIDDATDARIRAFLDAGRGINYTARECNVSRQAVRRRAEEREDARALELEREERIRRSPLVARRSR